MQQNLPEMRDVLCFQLVTTLTVHTVVNCACALGNTQSIKLIATYFQSGISSPVYITCFSSSSFSDCNESKLFDKSSCVE